MFHSDRFSHIIQSHQQLVSVKWVRMMQWICSTSLNPNGKALWVFGYDVLAVNLAFSGTAVLTAKKKEKKKNPRPLDVYRFSFWYSLKRSKATVEPNSRKFIKPLELLWITLQHIEWTFQMQLGQNQHSEGQAYANGIWSQWNYSIKGLIILSKLQEIKNSQSNLFHFFLKLIFSICPTSLLRLAFRQESLLLNNSFFSFKSTQYIKTSCWRS